MVLDLNRQGVSVSDIARRVGLDRKTVRRYLARGLEPPVYTPKVAAAADRRRTSTPPANSDTPRTGSSGLSASGRPVKP